MSLVVEHLERSLAPDTLLARVQSSWAEAVGPTVAAEARPVAAHDGVLTVACSSGVWAQELDLLGPTVVERLNAQLPAAAIRSLRCRVG